MQKPAMKDRILETADRLFYLQGIRAVGVDTIAAEIGISKRTLYNHFPSKDALISAYLARRFVAPRPSQKPPAEQILGNMNHYLFDELRFGASGSVETGHDHEKGVFPEVQVLFNPFGYDPAGDWKEQLSHPRIHLGTSIGTAGSASQLYSGLSWTMTYSSKIFTEAGFGGVVHNGNLIDEKGQGPQPNLH